MKRSLKPAPGEASWWKKYFSQFCAEQGIEPSKELTQFLCLRYAPRLAARLAGELANTPQEAWRTAAAQLTDQWSNDIGQPTERQPSPWKQAEGIMAKEDLREAAAACDPDA